MVVGYFVFGVFPSLVAKKETSLSSWNLSRTLYLLELFMNDLTYWFDFRIVEVTEDLNVEHEVE